MSAPAGDSARGLALTVLLLALCGAGGFLLYRATARRPELTVAPLAASRAAPAPAEAPEPADTPPAAARPIPERLPEVTLPGPDGRMLRLADFHGKLLVVNFWATWCEPCRREIPLLRAVRRERVENGFEVVGIAIDHPQDVTQFLRKQPIDYPIMIGEKGGYAAIEALGLDAVLPFSVFADRTGRIVTLKIGELHPAEAKLILDRMADLDAGRLTLASAREAIDSGIARLSAERARAGGQPQG